MMQTQSFLISCAINLLVLSGAETALAQTNFWQQTNGPTGGIVNALAINSSGDIFAGTESDGIFRTTDNGRHWTAVNSGLSNLAVLSLAINSSGHIFVGTETVDGVGGIYRSTDNGGHWNRINTGLPTPAAVNSLAIGSQGQLFAAVGGLFRSIDNGDHWMPTSLTNIPVFSIAIDGNDHIYVGTDGGVLRSTDDGSKWAAINAGISDRFVVAITVRSNGHIFIGTIAGPFGDIRGVFRSIDHGDTWTPINRGLRLGIDYCFAISPDGYLFAGVRSDFFERGSVFIFSDDDDKWKSTGLMDGAVFSLAFTASGQIFAGTYGQAVLGSDNYGETWESAGLINSDIYSLAINKYGHLFAGTRYGTGGVFRSMDNGDTWERAGSFLSHVLALAINKNGHIFAGVYSGFAEFEEKGVYRSTDNGNNWVRIGLTPNNWAATTFAINSHGHIFAGTGGQGVFRSTDNGDSWTHTGTFYETVNCLAINSNGHIFAGAYGGGIFRSTDNGDTWTNRSKGLANPYVCSLVINPRRGEIFAGTQGRFRTRSNGRVFRSDNNGETWTEVSAGLTGSDVRALVINDFGCLFAGTAGDGVFRAPETNRFCEIPISFVLEQNYPNPFNSLTSIVFSLPNSEHVTLKLYNTLGEEVATLVEERWEQGKHQVKLGASQFPSGVYFYRLQAGDFVEAKKLMVLK